MNNSRRRLNPRIIDTDWLVLTKMKRVIAEVAQDVARPGAVALDFGCGDRPYESVFSGRGCRYVGADFGDGCDVRIGANGQLPVKDGSADLVLSFQVLEHVSDLKTYFSEAHRTLVENGMMLLSTHGTWLYHPHPEDHRRWTRTGLVSEIENNGFEVLRSYPVVGPLAWTTMIRLTCISYALRKAPLVGGLLSAIMAVLMNAKAAIEDSVTPRWVTHDNACVYIVLCRRHG